MNKSNPVSFSKSSELETLRRFESADFPPHTAIVYAWKPAPGCLGAAMERAFSLRYRLLKRALDIALSLFLLIVLLPVGLALAFLVMLTSPGPIFYREERIGRFRVPFRILKFRSMYTSRPMSKVLDISTGCHIDPETNRFRKRMYDPRITPLGRMMRRMSLDELPQLWNVLVGEMSLVGPRPIVEAERHLYGHNLPYYDLFVPGITGLWQVSGRSEVDYDKRVFFDGEYATRWSCLLDFVILARTIPAVVSMRGAY
jgi:exopolysaccharide production protein ExoY